ncbi:MAG TPA: NAD(P)H-binding protein [Noviherbaspirillum sp.]|uniref:NAD(P)H-binding protein n=1 Tax=Noviherbaspirillum sp. TaxID=1926288 RepID=UPI002B494A30|nr:NAD(P)H-binding protein [Noviherbaspirillum sp.]HJV84212.1 NAD(P)H-binding protein [Noviherbaspirillum sp.]
MDKPVPAAASSTQASEPSARTVVLAGATGLVGRAILQGLLADASVAAVHALGRRPLTLQHLKLISHVVDFAALPPLPPVDEVYLALGTTIKIAGSQAAFRAVDFDASLAVARAAQAAGATRLGVVSAMGANARSSIFYNRVKGEMEDALSAMGFDALVIARPSLLTGDREALGQPMRSGEKFMMRAGAWLRPFIPANFKPIAADDVAAALLTRVPLAQGREVLLSGAMQSSA